MCATKLVDIISSTTIKIPHHTEQTSHEFNLTPLDLEVLLLEYNQHGILFRKPTPQQEVILLSKTNSSTLIQHLKQSLERTLQFFTPLAGHLVTTPVEGGHATCFSVDCHNNNLSAGALFVHAAAIDKLGANNLSVADILDSSSIANVPEVVYSFFPLTGVCYYEGDSQPLLGVQVTELVDGLFIGWSHSHLVADGTSFWHFINSWAQISRGDNPISKLPILNRDLINLDLTGSTSIKIDNERLNLIDNNAVSSTCQLKERVFHFTKKSVTKLKAKANQELLMLDSTINFGEISSLQAIIAHVWRSIIRHRFSMNTTTDIQETTFEIPMLVRQRFNPHLPDEYFGNAVIDGIVTLKAKEMLEKGLGWTAWQINKMVAGFYNNPNRVKDYYISWIKKPNFLKFDGLPRNYFVLINSPRFDVYGSDFGWGEPVAVRSGRGNSFDGRITVFGGVEKGSMEIQACLFHETLSALGEDPEFMKFVLQSSFSKHHSSSISSRL